ncbi:MAG: oligosaccharide flippase family protein [Candidatus Coproplasma sp.]
MKSQSYLKGALIISAGGFISKLLGAVYRIPLIAFLGGEGMGIYQMVYPLYCILLTVSASGIPTGIARVISSGGGNGTVKSAFGLYSLVGLIGSLIMFALSAPLAAVQGEPAVALCCKLLSPSVFFVSVLSVVRGYFQGKGNMYPTAVTEVCEQAIKVGFGVVLAYIFRADVSKAVAAAVFAVTVSEALSACLALSLYAGGGGVRKPLYAEGYSGFANILKYTVPLTFTAIALPFSQLAESILVVGILRGVTDNATALWGVFSGCAVTLVNLPVSVTYGLAAASVPKISPLAESGNIAAAKKETKKALLLTFLISLPFAVALFFFAPLAADIFFRSLKGGERQLLITLVRITSVNAVTLSLVQTSSACLTSLGKPLYGTATQWISSAARVALSAVLVRFTQLSVSGAAISANCCYLVAVLLNFCYIGRVNKGSKTNDNLNRSWSKTKRFKPVG